MKGVVLLLILALGLALAQDQTRPGTYAKKIETSNEEVRGGPLMTSRLFGYFLNLAF